MARPTDKRRDLQKVRALPGFDVTCVVGRVLLDAAAEESPLVAAFKLIGEHGAQGSFSFPLEDGSICHVDVEHVPSL